MADEALAQAGLHFDELNKIRVLEPDVFQQTTELKEECKDFVESGLRRDFLDKAFDGSTAANGHEEEMNLFEYSGLLFSLLAIDHQFEYSKKLPLILIHRLSVNRQTFEQEEMVVTRLGLVSVDIKCIKCSVAEMTTFQKIVGSFITTVDSVAQEVEKEKIKAIGSRNLLKSMSKQREAQQQQLQALIAEKRMQIERLRLQYESLQKEDSEQNEFIEQFILHK